MWIELVEKGWGYSLTSLGTGVAVDEWKGRVNRSSKKERKSERKTELKQEEGSGEAER